MKKFILYLFVAFTVLIPQFISLELNSYSVQAQEQKQEQTVVFNTKTHKIHKPDCSSAIRCTVNCITIKRSEAIKRGGIPCKRCGG